MIQIILLINIIIIWILIIVPSCAKHDFHSLAAIGDIFEWLIKGPDLEIFGTGPVRVPLGIVFLIPLTLFLIVFPAFEMINIWS